MNKTRYNFLEWMGILCIFSVFLDRAARGGGLPFDFYYYYPIYIVFLISFFVKYKTLIFPPTWFNLSVGAIFLSGFLVQLWTGILGLEFLKQAIGIVFSSFVLYNVLFVFGFNTKKIFEIYLKFAFFVALHGVLDNMLHIAGIHLTPFVSTGGFIYREYGIMGEPFYLAMALTPAIVYYLCYFKRTWANNRIHFITIAACYFVTYSSIAVTGLVIGILLSLYYNDLFSLKSGKFILLPILVVPGVLGLSYIINNIDLIGARVTDTSALFLASGIQTDNFQGINSSTFALYSNYIVARDSFFNNPFFGSGLGAHPLIYQETFTKYFSEYYLNIFGAQNQQDANSRFLRLMSETGLLGLILFLLGYIKFFAKKSYMSTPLLKELGAINYSIAVYILLGLIRNGNYINIGFFLFFFLYYFTAKQIKRGHLLEAQKGS